MTRPLALAFVIALLAASCSPEKRLNKLIANHPELRDTVYVHDTLVTKEVQKDTLFVSVPGDTVKVNEGKLHIRYVRLPGDTVWLEGRCDPDTVVKTITVPRIGPTITKNKIPWWVWLIIAVLGLTGLFQAIKK